MSKNFPIGVMDSGVGGLTVVKELQKILPNEDIIYFGDSKRMPYGNRSEDEIVCLANNIISFLEAKNVKAILLACNTVSSQIDNLKSNVPIFGIIKAGCLAAVEENTNNKIGLIATVATVKSKVYNNTINNLAPRKELISNDSRKLPKIINNQLEHKYLLDKHIKECINPIIEKGDINELILGCSHFPIIENEIQEIYPNLKLINPANKQVLLLKKYLEENNLLRELNQSQTIIYTTDDVKEFELSISRLGINKDKLEKTKLFEKD